MARKPAESPVDALALAVSRFYKLLNAVRNSGPRPDAGLEPAVLHLLLRISDDNCDRIADLAVCVHSEASTVSRQVSQLAAAGLAAKTPDPQDRRASIISLTEAGSARVEQMREARKSWFASLTSEWLAEDVSTLSTLIVRLSDEIERDLRDRNPADFE